MSYKICLDLQPKSEQMQILQDAVVNFNKPFLGNKAKFCVFLKNDKDETVGGISGHFWPTLKVFSIDYVYVPESLRNQGYGTKLMHEVEAEAIKRDNPKRMQREVRREMQRVKESTKPSTHAQDYMREELEKNKKQKKLVTKQEKEIQAERQFHLRQKKKKEKHRGH